MEIAVVTSEAELPQLLALMRGYCDFYNVTPTDASLLAMSRALIADPEREGVQFLATEDGEGAGFATLFWSWATSDAARIGVMNDLYVADASRRRGVGRGLVNVCLKRCRGRGARRLTWQTAPDNLQAQALYDRLGQLGRPGSITRSKSRADERGTHFGWPYTRRSKCSAVDTVLTRPTGAARRQPRCRFVRAQWLEA